MTEFGMVLSIESVVPLFCDNNGAIAQAKELRSHQKSKHIERRFHLIREIVGKGDVNVQRIDISENAANPLIKVMNQKQLYTYLEKWDMRYHIEWS